MLADSGDIFSQSPELRSVSGDGLYTLQEGYATMGFCNIWVSYRKTSCLQNLVPTPHRMWVQLQETL
jgi:hypothetical protein